MTRVILDHGGHKGLDGPIVRKSVDAKCPEAAQMTRLWAIDEDNLLFDVFGLEVHQQLTLDHARVVD